MRCCFRSALGGITEAFLLALGVARPADRRHSPCRRAKYRPSPAAAGHRLRPDRRSGLRSGESRWGCPVRRGWHKSWCSVRPCCARWLDRRLLLARPSTVLMRANDGRVDHGIFVVGVGGQVLKDFLPHSSTGPAAHARMNHPKVPKSIRQIAPRDSGAVAVQNRIHKQPVILGRTPFRSLPARQKSRNPLPLIIPQSIPLCAHTKNQRTRLHLHISSLMTPKIIPNEGENLGGQPDAKESVELGATEAFDRAFCGWLDGTDGDLAGPCQQEYSHILFHRLREIIAQHCEESTSFSARSRSTNAILEASARAKADALPQPSKFSFLGPETWTAERQPHPPTPPRSLKMTTFSPLPRVSTG